MSRKNVEESFINLNSPSGSDINLSNDVNSPGSNPFDKLSQIADSFNVNNTEKDPFHFSRNIDIDCGRESLGILQVDLDSIRFDDDNWLNVPEIHLDTENLLQISTENISNELNYAFLYSYRSGKISTGSSAPSSSFLGGLELCELSKIPSTSSLNSFTNIDSFSILNKGFNKGRSNNELDSDNVDVRRNDFDLEKSVKQFRHNIQSLPIVLDDIYRDEKMQVNKLANPYLKNFRKSESLLRRSFTLPQVLNTNPPEDNDFNDSVFIEAKHVASKIADDSILHLVDAELYSLDCTPQPDLVDISDAIEDEPSNCTETVFKTVDKMIPSKDTVEIICTKENSLDENANKTIDSTSSTSSLTRNNCLQNLSGIFGGDSKKLSTSRLSQYSNNSKSQDTKSILHNLSEILSNDHPSAQQKSEGQHLLFSLADILCSNDDRHSLTEQEQSEDSGHSSIDHDILSTNKQEINTSCDALDLRINVESISEQMKPLDLSISKGRKLKEPDEMGLKISESQFDMNMKKSSKLSSCISTNKSRNISTCSSNSRNLSNMKTNMSDLPSFGKLKPKRIDKNVIPEKGPLKAMIPIGNMAKSKGRICTTPTKNYQYTSGYKVKRTSTPKMESKPQPVAQSTPDGYSTVKKGIPTSTQLRQRKLEAPISPLTRANSIGNESTEELNPKNRSDSAPSLLSPNTSKNTTTLNSNKTMFRRRSASEITVSKDDNKLKRSNTIDKDSGIAKTLNRVRGNIEKARKFSLTDSKQALNAKPIQNKLVLGERNRSSSTSNIKPCNLANKMRRSNAKENVCK